VCCAAVGWFVAHTALNTFKWRDLDRVSCLCDCLILLWSTENTDKNILK